MKKRFNLKLTMFLVSLFVSLLILVLGNKNIYCLSFGLILLGVSLGLFIYYAIGETDIAVKQIEEDIDEIDAKTEEDGFMLQDLYTIQRKLNKKNIN